jgi:NAD(P)-dependent dehydrogenase (short-subunit alcohol dehydrogenase family)
MDFQGKKMVITGAGPDLGRTLAVCFARLGVELFLSARSLEKASGTEELVKSLAPGATAHSFQADMTKPDEIRAFAEGVAGLTPSVDILVNNASAWLQGDLGAADDESIVQTIHSTVTGTILATKHFLPLLRRSDEPDIVNINGTPGLPGNRHSTAHPAFSAAKAAQAAFADRLRHRERGTGLRVITICPPNFHNTAPWNEGEWNERRGAGEGAKDYLTARNVFECVRFALSQDRICSVDQIILSNNNRGPDD